jgi:L-gulonolactone oxidase
MAALGKPSTHWRNWGRSASAHFAEVATPADEIEVAGVLRRAASAGLSVRPLGAGHSFTPIAATDGISLRLDRLSGVRRAELATGRVTLAAGTRLRDLPALLEPYGLALQNMGDIDHQSIAGAISTGTHGTGADFTGLAGQVVGLRIALADGSVVDCSATERPDLFEAARVGLGAFGVLTEVTVQCVPAFLLAADEHQEPLDAVLDGFAERMTAADHVEFYWFPHTDTALVKSNRRLPLDAGRSPVPRWRSLVDDELLSNGVFAGTCAAGAIAPWLIPPVNRLAARLVSQRSYTDLSYRVFTSPRRVRFREMEYALPRAELPDVLRAIRTLIAGRGWRISFPLEIRVAAADDVWLSTAYQRPSAYVAVHRYHREPFAEYFSAVEDLFTGVGGRPHWGKLHTRDADYLATAYPRFADALRVRAEVDPDGLFANPYLDRVLGRDTVEVISEGRWKHFC